ncbi:MAG: CHAT domain-containing tetratricopeptide repeat protein [Cyanobacteria bacterium J06632_19]
MKITIIIFTIINSIICNNYYFLQHKPVFAVSQSQLSQKSAEADKLSKEGMLEAEKGAFEVAIKLWLKALEIYREIKDSRGEAWTLNYLAFGNHSLSRYKASIYYSEASLKIAIKLGDNRLKKEAETNLGLAQYVYTNPVGGKGTLRKAGKNWRFLLELSEWGRTRAFVQSLSSQLSLNSIEPITIQQIQQIAKEQNATLVEYSLRSKYSRNGTEVKSEETEIYIWIIKPNVNRFKSVDIKSLKGVIPIDNLIADMRISIGARGRRATIGLKPAIEIPIKSDFHQEQNLKRLYKLLIQPIADLLPEDPKERVIFIPDKSLFLVPFPALQDAHGKYLISKHTVLTAPSIQVLDLTKKQRVKVEQANLQGAVVVGNPTMPKVTIKLGDPPQQLKSLPAAEREAILIGKLLDTKPFTGVEASKTKIVPKLSQARIIHLATHGLLDDFKGLGIPGAIALAPSGNGKTNDGLLTANEILDLKLNAELVVLSACDTGRGRITSDSVIGLSRSLIIAGASSVVVSLWSVPDAPTAELMSEFYRNWLDGKLDKAQALRQAMLTTMKKRPNPRNWAAFTLIGETK